MLADCSLSCFVILCSLFLNLSNIISAQDAATSTKTGPTHRKVVVCYISTWATYRPGKGSFSIDNLDPNLCTHLVYAFAGLNATSNAIKSLDPWNDLKDDYGKGMYERTTGLKSRYPHLKVTLALGGWNEGSTNYSKMAANPADRAALVNSAVRFLKKYNFDGLDLDWEYPGKRGGIPEDKENFVSLVKELKTAFRKHGYILTAAVGAARETITTAYNVPELSKYLDLIHLMCYDYHGAWDGVAGPNAPLHTAESTDWLSVAYSVDYMLSLGAPADKLVLGMPMYGRTFIRKEGSDPAAPALGAAVKPAGFQGPFTREDGFIGYNEICMELAEASWKEHWDEVSLTPYASSGDKIIMFDNQRSIADKVRFAMSKKLRGVMVWSIDTDDFHGYCPPETDIYLSWHTDLQKIREEPYYNEIKAMLRLNLTDRGGRLDSAYKLSHDGELSLIIAPRERNINFPVMRTISEAVSLSEQEAAIKQQVDLLSREKDRENEISNKIVGNGAIHYSANYISVVLISTYLIMLS